MEIYELLHKEFKIIFLNKFSKLQEHTERQLSEMRKIMHEQNKKFNEEIETIQKKNRNSTAEKHND